MDVVDQTAAIGKEDALPKVVVGETKAYDDAGPEATVVSTCGTGDDGGADLKEKVIDVATDAKQEVVEPAADVESGDDLLDKIEQVVKEDGTSNGKEATVADSAIAESSEQDFLQRLEDVEHETDKAESKKSEEDGSAAEVEECVTSSDEKESVAAGNAPEESDETDRALSDNIVDSTSQELEAKVSEKVVPVVKEAKEAQSSEEVTEIISSEDDENAEQTHAKNGVKSAVVVEISSDEGSNEVALVEKSSSDSEVPLAAEEVTEKEAQSSTVDEKAAVTLENGTVDLAVPDTSEATPVETSEVAVASEKKSNEQAEIEAVSSEANPEIDSSEVKISEVLVVSEEPAESQVPEESSIAKADTEPMSVDVSPANTDTMEVDEEEKMDVEMAENVSENDEEMPADEKIAEETVEAVKVDKTVVKEIEAVSTTETVAADLVEEAAEIIEEKTIDTLEPVAEAVKQVDVEVETVVEASNAEVSGPIDVEKEKIEISEPVTKESTPAASPQKDASKSSPVTTPSKQSDVDVAIEIIESTSEETVVQLSKTEEKIQQEIDAIDEKSISDAEQNAKLTTEPVCEKTTADPKSSMGLRVENKLLANTMKHGGSIASLDGSPVSAATGGNVFNSTPIQKQFEISSENVSKISEANDEVNRTEEAAQISKTDEESTEIGTTTTSESENQTDSVTKYLNVVKQYNGIAAAEEKPIALKPTQKTSSQSDFDIMPADLLSSYADSDSKKSQYEINVWYEERGIRFLSVEKLENIKKSIHATLDTTSGGDSSEKLSSNGSVSSLPPFTLPNRASDMSLSGSSMGGSQKISDLKPSFPVHVKRNKHTVTGIVELCTFMIDQFTKIKHEIEPPKVTEPTTPKLKGRGSDSIKKSASKGKSASPQVLSAADGGAEVDETPTKKIDKRTLKRTLNKSSLSDDDDESKPKSAKQSKTTMQPKTPSKNTDVADLSVIGYSVLAKWIDKKYYAGKVTDARAGNKFVILFEDGASKVLPKESVVFGEEDILPLQDQSVYALIDDDYEVGLVKSIEKTDDQKVVYTIEINGNNVKVSASEIYITDQQAKAIQCLKAGLPATPTTSSSAAASTKGGAAASSDTPADKSSPADTNTSAASRSTRNKRQATSPITPEAGFSGGVTKRGRRQKRPSLQQTRISESSDISDSPEISNPPAPSSPESALEAIEGVQPELQKTPKESEISRMMIISDYMKQEPSRDISELLGPLPKSKTLFKNKYFILTCTVGQKLPPIGNSSMNNSNEITFTNKNAIFSAVPFIKQQLQKQIQEGGGTVYNHFEDIPKTKYKQCKLISSRPCTTAKYVQCLAADMQPISHEWIIESCTNNSLADFKKYLLPSGWSIINETYIKWTLRKSIEYRQTNKPFWKEIVLIASEHDDFVTFWSRVCKLAGATLRYVKKLSDVTPTTAGYMVTEQDFPQVIKSKAEHYGIPIVSTLWIVQSLISGKVCDPLSHGKFTQIYQDDDL